MFIHDFPDRNMLACSVELRYAGLVNMADG